jgi:hypothetical protein
LPSADRVLVLLIPISDVDVVTPGLRMEVRTLAGGVFTVTPMRENGDTTGTHRLIRLWYDFVNQIPKLRNLKRIAVLGRDVYQLIEEIPCS